MSAGREAIAAALFSTVSAAYAWGSTPSRRLVLWNDVPASQRPALFVSEAQPETYTWGAQPNAKRVYGFRLWVYIDAHNPAAIGAQQFNAILDAIDAALAPSPGFQKQTLGGLCDNCRVKGVSHKDPGDLDGDGVLIVEVEIIAP